MPNWKKVVVSGSDALISHLTASGGIKVAGNLLIASNLQHVGDDNNEISFGTDTQDFRTNNSSRLDISNSGIRLGGANARVTTVLDEDAMGSDSATALATQQSIKAYVDANAGSGDVTLSGAQTFTGTKTFGTNTKLGFRDADIVIHSSTDGQLDIDADSTVQIATTTLDINGAVDISGTTALGNTATIASTKKLQFRDTGLYINSSTDGQLDIVADTEIQIAATTIDINGAINASGEIIAASLDISGNIDVDGTTNLDAVDIDGNVDVAGNLTFSGAGRTLANSTGDLTIDVEGDVVIDANGADVILKDDGTEFGRFKRDSSDFIIKSATNNKDLVFRGVDNSSTITALTLDMSDAGKALFNSHISASGGVTASNFTGSFTGDGSSLTGITAAPEIDGLGALGGTGLHQTQDHFVFSDNGTEKKITFSNLEDAIFGNVSGDATIAAGGALTIANTSVETEMLADNAVDADKLATNAVVNASVASSAAIAYSKLAAMTSARILVGNGSNVPTVVAVSGDATLANNGAVTLAAAQTNVNSILATDLVLGEDSQTKIDFETANEIHFDANNAQVLNVKAGGIDVTGNIVPSGNVSGSATSTGSFGQVIVSTLFSRANDANTGLEFGSDTVAIQGNDVKAGTFASTKVILHLPVTASSDINAAGNISASGYISTETNITASSNISASGTVNARFLHIPKAAANNNISDGAIHFGSTTGDNGYIYDDDTNLIIGYNDTDVIQINSSGISGGVKGTLLGTAAKFGRDTHNLIDFTTDNAITFRVNNANEITLNANNFGPTTSDGIALGTASKMWSDLFLASGAVINFNNGDITLTHTSNHLTFAGGTLVVPTLNLGQADHLITDGSNFLDSSDNTIIEFADDSVTFQCSTLTAGIGTKTSIGTRKWARSSTTNNNLSAGDVTYTGGEGTIAAGDIVYMDTSGNWQKAQANSTTTSIGILGIALGNNAGNNGILLRGMFTLDHDVANNQGIPLYLSDTTAGQAITTAPDTSGDIVRIIGYNLGDDDQIWFSPDNTFVQVA